MWQKLAEGTNISAIAFYESQFSEKQRGRLDLNLRLTPPASTITWLRQELINRGVAEADVKANGSRVSIYWKKEFDPLTLIAVIVVGIVVLAALIIGWKLFREVGVPVVSNMPIWGWVVIGACLILLLAFYVARTGKRTMAEVRA